MHNLRKVTTRLLCLLAISTAALAGVCYTNLNLPRTLAESDEAQRTNFEAVAASEALEALFVGGQNTGNKI